MKKALAAVAAGFALVVGVAFASSASATETPAQSEKVCPDFELRDATGKYPELNWVKSANSKIVDGSIKLEKPKGENLVDPSTEFKIDDLGLSLSGTATVKVDYALLDGAKPDATAVRMFYYSDATKYNVDAPTKMDAATAENGTLQFEVGPGKLGLLGIVYGADNDSAGVVMLSNLRVGDIKVSFDKKDCQTASPSPSASASPKPASPSPGVASPSPSMLPVTGSKGDNASWLAYVGGGLVVGAVVAFIIVFMTRRRNTFRA